MTCGITDQRSAADRAIPGNQNLYAGGDAEIVAHAVRESAGGYADYMRNHDIPAGGWNEPDDDADDGDAAAVDVEDDSDADADPN